MSNDEIMTKRECRMTKEYSQFCSRARHCCARRFFGIQRTVRPTSFCCSHGVMRRFSGRRARGSPDVGRLRPISPPCCADLWRDAIRQRVGMEIDVLTQTVPRTILAGCLGNSALLTGGKVVPRIVACDGQERPRCPFQMLH